MSLPSSGNNQNSTGCLPDLLAGIFSLSILAVAAATFMLLAPGNSLRFSSAVCWKIIIYAGPTSTVMLIALLLVREKARAQLGQALSWLGYSTFIAFFAPSGMQALQNLVAGKWGTALGFAAMGVIAVGIGFGLLTLGQKVAPKNTTNTVLPSSGDYGIKE